MFGQIGDIVCDMHDGLDLSYFGPTAKIVHSMRAHRDNNQEAIEAMTGKQYTNKHLVIIGYDENQGHYICAYSYDDRNLNFVEIKV